MYEDKEDDSDQESTVDGRSLIVIFPIRRLDNAAKARPHARLSEPLRTRIDVSENEDRTKRRRLYSDEHACSTNPHTGRAHIPVANLDPRTKHYELLRANDKITENEVENTVMRSEAYQRTSSAERPALVEQARNDLMNARYVPHLEGTDDILTLAGVN
jgi:predicted ATPase with chaperone activity